MTGWRRTHRSGEGKMIALLGRGICSLRYRSFPAFFRLPEFSGELTCEKNEMCAGWDRSHALQITSPRLYP